MLRRHRRCAGLGRGTPFEERVLVARQKLRRDLIEVRPHFLGKSERAEAPLDAIGGNDALRRPSCIRLALHAVAGDREVNLCGFEIGNRVDQPERGDAELFLAGFVLPRVDMADPAVEQANIEIVRLVRGRQRQRKHQAN
jgi:hypothetical protein